jgi:hypothetical protein
MRIFVISTPAKAGAHRPAISDAAGWAPACAGVATLLGE